MTDTSGIRLYRLLSGAVGRQFLATGYIMTGTSGIRQTIQVT